VETILVSIAVVAAREIGDNPDRHRDARVDCKGRVTGQLVAR
jgi:hypothetical protein